MKTKIFEGENKQDVINELLREGYKPATIKEIYDLKKVKKIPIQWYDSGTVFFNGNFRKATVSELKNLKKFYDKKGRLLFLSYNFGGLNGNYDLDDFGRFVGVAPEAHRKKK